MALLLRSLGPLLWEPQYCRGRILGHWGLLVLRACNIHSREINMEVQYSRKPHTDYASSFVPWASAWTWRFWGLLLQWWEQAQVHSTELKPAAWPST